MYFHPRQISAKLYTTMWRHQKPSNSAHQQTSLPIDESHTIIYVVFQIRVGCGTVTGKDHAVSLQYSTDLGLSWSTLIPTQHPTAGCYHELRTPTVYYPNSARGWTRVVIPLTDLQICGSVKYLVWVNFPYSGLYNISHWKVHWENNVFILQQEGEVQVVARALWGSRDCCSVGRGQCLHRTIMYSSLCWPWVLCQWSFMCLRWGIHWRPHVYTPQRKPTYTQWRLWKFVSPNFSY